MNALGIPAKDTAAANWANAADTSIILIRPGDSTLWYKYKGNFRKVGTGGGTAIVDTVNTISSKPWRQKGIDSVSANLVAGLALKLNITDTSSMLSPYYRTALANATIVQRITDSLRSLVRLRASGSGGIQLQNSVGTNVADFGIANTTNGSIAGGWNVGGNLAVTGTSGFTGKATFTDSIVGVNQRLSGNISAATFNGSALGSYAYRSSGLAELSGATFTGDVLFRNTVLFDDNGTAILSAQGNPSTNFIINSRGGLTFQTGGAAGASTTRLTIASTGAATFSSSATVQGALTATAQGNNITVGVDSSVTSTSYTLVLGDAGYLKRCSNASAITITVPTNASVAFPIGTTIYFSQQGAGKVSVSPATSDVTIQSEGNLLGTAGQHAVIGLIKVNTNRWLLVGNRG